MMCCSRCCRTAGGAGQQRGGFPGMGGDDQVRRMQRNSLPPGEARLSERVQIARDAASLLTWVLGTTGNLQCCMLP
jgi:hypothetical protein